MKPCYCYTHIHIATFHRSVCLRKSIYKMRKYEVKISSKVPVHEITRTCSVHDDFSFLTFFLLPSTCTFVSEPVTRTCKSQRERFHLINYSHSRSTLPLHYPRIAQASSTFENVNVLPGNRRAAACSPNRMDISFGERPRLRHMYTKRQCTLQIFDTHTHTPLCISRRIPVHVCIQYSSTLKKWTTIGGCCPSSTRSADW